MRVAIPDVLAGPFLSALSPLAVTVEGGGQVHTPDRPAPPPRNLATSRVAIGVSTVEQKGGRARECNSCTGTKQTTMSEGRAAHLSGENRICLSELLGRTRGQGQDPWATDFLCQASSKCRVKRHFSWGLMTGRIPGFLSGFLVLVLFGFFFF